MSALNQHIARRIAVGAVLLVATSSMSACRTSSYATRPGAPSAAPFAAKPVAPSAAQYALDSQQSQVLVLVYRDGPMGHLGHNHVIAVRELTGTIAADADPALTNFQMDFPVETLSVDEPQLRAAQGADFDSTLDEAAVAGTRDHMLGMSLLNSKQFPSIHLQSEQVRTASDGLHAVTRITVRETTATVDIPVDLQRSEDQLIANGEFDLTHSQLGLTPYSVALGALRVAERMHIRYRLVARRVR
jgi:polyisoprenoid-binding protein YceI